MQLKTNPIRDLAAFFGVLLFVFSPLLQAAPPNVVILLADDAGWGDYGFNGNQQVRTPNIDSLARSGATLSKFYVCAVCSPTRAELLTGRYHTRCGVRGVSLGQERLNLDETTFADVFKKAGYATGIFGKWHNGSQWPFHPMARGFDTFFGYTAGHWGEYFNPSLEHEGRMEPHEGYIVDICTSRALEFIEQNRSRPFVCYVPFTTPHSPWGVPQKNWMEWKDRKIEQSATEPARQNLDETRCVMAMIENQDENVGRILNKLDELNLSENTIVLFFSDNGPNTARWNGEMKGIKGSIDEGGLRSPCVMRWPAKIRGGHVVEKICGAIDVLPTIAELAGINPRIDKPLDGLSLAPLLLQKSGAWPDRNLFTHWAGNIGVRNQKYRMDARGNLFDMDADPGQMSACNEQEPSMAKSLEAALARWRQESGAETLGVRRQEPVDPRPFTVGYREFPVTMLPARDGVPRGGLKRSASAPNSSYFVQWTSADCCAVWNVDVHTSGTYEVWMDYTCAVGDENCVMRVEFGGASVDAKVTKAWDPPLHDNQDTIPRPKVESRMKPFASMMLGRIKLQAGIGELSVRAIDIPGKAAIDLRRLTLTLTE